VSVEDSGCEECDFVIRTIETKSISRVRHRMG
jgi:hypothetical protein